MENFDLDQLQKKSPYRVPENFFEDMQENVLKKTRKQGHKQPKIFKINFSTITSFAAALALIFGVAFLWKTNQTEITKPSKILKDTLIENVSKKDDSVLDLTQKVEIQKEENEERLSLPENKPLAKNDIIGGNDNNYEQLLNSLTDDDITELSKNSDQDIYLELYN